jgi:hypothetical protein
MHKYFSIKTESLPEGDQFFVDTCGVGVWINVSEANDVCFSAVSWVDLYSRRVFQWKNTTLAGIRAAMSICPSRSAFYLVNY